MRRAASVSARRVASVLCWCLVGSARVFEAAVVMPPTLYACKYAYVKLKDVPHLSRALLLFSLALPLAWAQFSAPPPPPTPARQLPLSGRGGQAGSVATPLTTIPGGGGNDTLTGSVQVSGGYQGSVPAANVPAGAITLALADAVKFGLSANLGILTSSDATRVSEAERLHALSALLPYVSISATQTSNEINLAAFGFQFKTPPGLNFSIPTVVGPFGTSNLQGNFSQTVWDLTQRRNWQATKDTEHASQLSARDARELVVLAVAGSYLETVATAARVESQRAQVANARAVNQQAEARRQAGTNARIEVTRTLVELQSQEQRLSAFESDLRKQKLALARLIGLPLDRELMLSDPLAFNPPAVPDPATASQQAFQKRWDLQAADAQVQAAERIVAAARAERLPSVSLNGDYGVLGSSPIAAHGVFSVAGTVNFPMFQGGRVKADIEQAEATLHQRQAELADLRGSVEAAGSHRAYRTGNRDRPSPPGRQQQEPRQRHLARGSRPVQRGRNHHR